MIPDIEDEEATEGKPLMDICPKIILWPDGDLVSLAKAVSHAFKTP